MRASEEMLEEAGAWMRRAHERFDAAQREADEQQALLDRIDDQSSDNDEDRGANAPARRAEVERELARLRQVERDAREDLEAAHLNYDELDNRL